MSWKNLGKKSLSGLWSVALYMTFQFCDSFNYELIWDVFVVLQVTSIQPAAQYSLIICLTGIIILLILLLIEWPCTDHSLMGHHFLSLTEILTQCHQTQVAGSQFFSSNFFWPKSWSQIYCLCASQRLQTTKRFGFIWFIFTRKCLKTCDIIRMETEPAHICLYFLSEYVNTVCVWQTQ